MLTAYAMFLDQCLLSLTPTNMLKDVVVTRLGCVNPVQAVLQGNTCHRHARKIRLGCAPRVALVQLAPTEQGAAVLPKAPVPAARQGPTSPAQGPAHCLIAFHAVLEPTHSLWQPFQLLHVSAVQQGHT